MNQPEKWTIERMLTWSKSFFAEKGLESARLDSELLLSHVLKVDRIGLYTQYDRPLEPEELAAYRAVVKRRVAREPVAYITGERAFWTIDLKCDRRALIPRPETEVVLEAALARVKKDDAAVLDVGTGTGALALAFLTERPQATATLLDVSAEALALARENAESLGLSDRTAFVESDLLAGVTSEFDLILSNPPYVGTSERDLMDRDVKDYEPDLALFAGNDGLDLIRRLVPQAFGSLSPGGWFAMEFGFRQGDAVRKILTDTGFAEVEILQDYSGHDRVGVGQKHG